MGDYFTILNVLVAKSRAVGCLIDFIGHTLPFFANKFLNALFYQLLDFGV